MAIIKLGTTVVGIRGTIDGITFSQNKGGAYAKGWSRGSNPRTPRQNTQRNNQANPAGVWRTITAAQRTAWNAYAALPAQQLFNSLGIGYFVSGFSWFVSMNSNLLRAGLPINNPAPVLAQPGVSPTLLLLCRSTASGQNSFIRFNLADPLLTLRKALFIFIANSIGKSVAPTLTPLMTIEAPAFTEAIIFKTQMEQKFGTIVVGQICFAKYYNQNAEGRRSAVTKLSINVT